MESIETEFVRIDQFWTLSPCMHLCAFVMNSPPPSPSIRALWTAPNCSALDWIGRNFPTIQNSSEKRKTSLFNEIGLKKRAIRKGHTRFFLFSFLGFEIGANRFSIEFCIRKFNLFSQKCKRGTKKSRQTWKSRLKVFWNLLWDL